MCEIIHLKSYRGKIKEAGGWGVFFKLFSYVIFLIRWGPKIYLLFRQSCKDRIFVNAERQGRTLAYGREVHNDNMYGKR